MVTDTKTETEAGAKTATAIVEAKQAGLEATIVTAKQAIEILPQFTAEYDEAYARYLNANKALGAIPVELATAKRSDNAAGIKADCITIGLAIRELLANMTLADKLGEPVELIVWTQSISDTEPTVTVNPKVKLPSTGPRATTTGKRPVIVALDGSTMSPTAFVKKFAKDSERVEFAPEGHVWPHTLANKPAKFAKFCTEHNVTGYRLEQPES